MRNKLWSRYYNDDPNDEQEEAEDYGDFDPDAPVNEERCAATIVAAMRLYRDQVYKLYDEGKLEAERSALRAEQPSLSDRDVRHVVVGRIVEARFPPY